MPRVWTLVCCNIMRYAKCHPSRRHEARDMCEQCYSKWHRDNNKEARRELNKKWKKNNRYKVARQQRQKGYPVSCYKYGLTAQGYRNLAVKFKGICPICSRLETVRRLSIDHDHTTGRVRGMLCRKCNISLGNFEDNPEWLRRAALYLEGRLSSGSDTETSPYSNR